MFIVTTLSTILTFTPAAGEEVIYIDSQLPLMTAEYGVGTILAPESGVKIKYCHIDTLTMDSEGRITIVCKMEGEK